MTLATVDRGAQVASDHGAGPRSPYWEEAKNNYLKVTGETCDACDPSYYGRVGVQVHHVHAFHVCVLLGRGGFGT